MFSEPRGAGATSREPEGADATPCGPEGADEASRVPNGADATSREPEGADATSREPNGADAPDASAQRDVLRRGREEEPMTQPAGTHKCKQEGQRSKERWTSVKTQRGRGPGERPGSLVWQGRRGGPRPRQGMSG